MLLPSLLPAFGALQTGLRTPLFQSRTECALFGDCASKAGVEAAEEEEIRQATQALEILRDRLKATGARLAAAEGQGGEDDETSVPTSAVILCVVLDHLDPAIADLRAVASDSPSAEA
jgi:hypothetical protein